MQQEWGEDLRSATKRAEEAELRLRRLLDHTEFPDAGAGEDES